MMLRSKRQTKMNLDSKDMKDILTQLFITILLFSCIMTGFAFQINGDSIIITLAFYGAAYYLLYLFFKFKQ